jgi:hypothetical protein
MAEFIKEAPKFVTARECVTRAVKTLEAHTHETLKKLRHTISDTFSGQNVRVRTPLARWRTKLSELLTTTRERDARKLVQMCLIIIAVLASGFHARDA